MNHHKFRGAGAGPAGTAAAGPMLEAELMNLIKGRLQKFWLSNNVSIKFTHSRAPAASPDQSWYASDATISCIQLSSLIIVVVSCAVMYMHTFLHSKNSKSCQWDGLVYKANACALTTTASDKFWVVSGEWQQSYDPTVFDTNWTLLDEWDGLRIIMQLKGECLWKDLPLC